MKNPIFYANSNANSFKKKIAWRKIILASFLLLFTFAFTIASTPKEHRGKVAGTSLAIVMVAYKAGVQGEDESKEDFEARKGKEESPEAFVKRSLIAEVKTGLLSQIDARLKNFKEQDAEFKALLELKGKVESLPNIEAKLKALQDDLAAKGVVIESLKKASVGAERGIVKGSIAETLVKSKEQIDAFLTGKSGKSLVIEHKGNAQTETSTDITSRNFYAEWHEPGVIGQIPVRKPFLRELFKNRTAGTEYLKYTDQNTVVRDAQNVALCATSTGNTKATWIVRTMQIQKVRDFIDICNDMMSDYLFVAGEVQNLLDSSVKLKIDDQLLNGTGVAPQLNSLASIASAWVPNFAGTKDYTNSVANANMVDLIVVAGSQIQELGKNNSWNPNYVLVNPGDYTLMRLLKNSFGDTLRMNPNLFIDANGNMFIAGMKVMSNPNITANTFWIGDFTRGTVYSIPGVGIEFSYENATNFETETVTVNAYERLNLLVRNVDTNAFINVSDINASLALINKP